MGVRDMGFGLRVRMGISKQAGALLLGLRLVHSGLHWRPVCMEIPVCHILIICKFYIVTSGWAPGIFIFSLMALIRDPIY